MQKYIKKWLVRNLITTFIFGGFYMSALTGQISTAEALTVIQTVPVQITDSYASTSAFDPWQDQTVTLNYCLNAPAKVTLGIYHPSGNTSHKVSILTNNETKNTGCYSAVWDGKYGYLNEIGTKDNIVEDGQYFYYIKADGLQGFSTGTSSVSKWLTVGLSTPADSDLKIVDIEIENSVFDPWDDQKAEITFTINKDAYITLEIFDNDDEKITTLVDNKWYTKGEYTVYWNGENDSKDIVSQDEYTYKLKTKSGSDTDKKTGTLQVKKGYDNNGDQTEDPRIKNLYITKESFDPGRKEKEYIVFTLTAKADLKVTIYDKNDNKIATLFDENNQSAGTYKIEWDGSELIDSEKATYTYKVYAKNAKGEDIEDGKIKIAEDDEDNKTANIYKDNVDQISYSPKNNNLGISFKLEKAAEITVEIRDSKHLIATVVEDEEFTEGSHTVYWNGKDNDGDVAEDGLYKYKIISKNNKGKDTEEGNFSVEGSTQAKYKANLCAQFTDITDDYKYCDAIEWTVGTGIVQGYNDGTFRPNQPINRAEALKVILKALKVNILSSNGEPLGFNDTDRYEWYAPYIKTGVALGIIHGYKDGSFKPYQSVNRLEALIMLLNTGKAKDNLIIPTNNIGQPYYDTPDNSENKWYLSYVWFAKAYSLTDNNTYFYPGEKMSRGEMVDMLYRYHQNNFDNLN